MIGRAGFTIGLVTLVLSSAPLISVEGSEPTPQKKTSIVIKVKSQPFDRDMLYELNPKDPYFQGLLTSFIQNESSEVRVQAVVGVREIGLKDRVIDELLLKAMLNDPEVIVRTRAIDALGRPDMRDPSIIQALIRATHDQHHWTRAHAGFALGNLHRYEPKILSTLAKMLDKESKWRIGSDWVTKHVKMAVEELYRHSPDDFLITIAKLPKKDVAYFDDAIQQSLLSRESKIRVLAALILVHNKMAFPNDMAASLLPDLYDVGANIAIDLGWQKDLGEIELRLMLPRISQLGDVDPAIRKRAINTLIEQKPRFEPTHALLRKELEHQSEPFVRERIDAILEASSQPPQEGSLKQLWDRCAALFTRIP